MVFFMGELALELIKQVVWGFLSLFFQAVGNIELPAPMCLMKFTAHAANSTRCPYNHRGSEGSQSEWTQLQMNTVKGNTNG